jgi:hypothetical protein
VADDDQPAPGAGSNPPVGASSGRPTPVDGSTPLDGSSSRPFIERLGLAAVAVVLGALFGGVAVAAWTGGEPFLAAMGAIGCLMTLWVGALTLLRG